MRTGREIMRRRLIILVGMVAVAVAVPLALWLVDTQVTPLDLLLNRTLAKMGL